MKVLVSSPSRLHVTLLDVGYATPRIFGGVGIVLQNPRVVVEVEASDKGNFIRGVPQAYAREVKKVIDRLQSIIDGSGGVRVTVCAMPEPHVGLGSKTAVLLATAKAVCVANDFYPSAEELRNLSGRGGTSGIGVHAFFRGGVLFDGGHATGPERRFAPSSAGSRREVPPLVASGYPPDDWRVTLVRPSFGIRISGPAEQAVFDQAPVSNDEVLKVIAAVHQGIMPAVALNDLNLLAQSIDVINCNGFKKLEIDAQPPSVRDLINNLRSETGLPVGMSSMGSTLFVIHSAGHQGVADVASTIVKNLGGTCVTETVSLATEGHQVEVVL